MISEEEIRKALDDHAEAVEDLWGLAPVVAAMGERVALALRGGGKVLICGNGGSASQADHFAGEIVGRFVSERRGLPAIALGAGLSALTAIANDYGYEESFARQVEAFGAKGDVLVAITTSGNSPNVVRAVERARELGLGTLGLSGRDGGKLAGICDACLVVGGESTARIQEAHIVAIHLMCAAVDKAFAEGA